MVETTIERAATNLAEIVRQCQRRDEQFHLFERGGDISPPVKNVPQPNPKEPVAVVISMSRYQWLIGRSAELDALTGGSSYNKLNSPHRSPEPAAELAFFCLADTEAAGYTRYILGMPQV